MQLSDREILNLCNARNTHPMLSPLYPATSGDGVISYGLTSYGYDSRLGNEFAVQEGGESSAPIDPKKSTERNFRRFTSDIPFTLAPHGFLLARTTETFHIPRSILVICVGKSTYARCGLNVTTTPLEPEWGGVVTLELSNLTNAPITIYPNEGICQFIFLRSEVVCEVSYADKKGKYQWQTGVTLARVTK